MDHPTTILDGVTFEHRVAGPHGHRLHYVTGGSGDPLLLVAGWPQTWFAWRRVMPALARRFTVVAVDPPGMGDSDRPDHGYDTAAVAARLHELVRGLGWDRFHLVVHDIGCWIGYPFAAAYGDTVRSLTMIDAAVPGIIPAAAYEFAPERIHRNWHFAFNALPDLPELLITGRERAFLTWLFHAKTANPTAIEPAALDEYVRCYAAPGGLRGGYGYYRAIFQDIEQNRAYAAGPKLAMPVLAVGGAGGIGGLMEQMMRAVAEDVRGVVIDCGHYVPEEAPGTLLGHLTAFLG